MAVSKPRVDREARAQANLNAAVHGVEAAVAQYAARPKQWMNDEVAAAKGSEDQA